MLKIAGEFVLLSILELVLKLISIKISFLKCGYNPVETMAALDYMFC